MDMTDWDLFDKYIRSKGFKSFKEYADYLIVSGKL